MCIKGNVGHNEEWVYSTYLLIYSESIKEIVSQRIAVGIYMLLCFDADET